MSDATHCRDENPSAGHLGRDIVDQHQADESFSEFRASLFRDFAGTVSAPVMDEILDAIMEHGRLNGRRNGEAHKGDESKWKAAFIKILAYIFKRHPSPQVYAVLYIWGEEVLDDIYGNLSQSEFAATLSKNGKKMTKAAINKAVMDAQRFFGTPKRSDQRDNESCEKMRIQRKSKLKHHEN